MAQGLRALAGLILDSILVASTQSGLTTTCNCAPHRHNIILRSRNAICRKSTKFPLKMLRKKGSSLSKQKLFGKMEFLFNLCNNNKKKDFSTKEPNVFVGHIDKRGGRTQFLNIQVSSPVLWRVCDFQPGKC
jgi:hypothetical protein